MIHLNSNPLLTSIARLAGLSSLFGVTTTEKSPAKSPANTWTKAKRNPSKARRRRQMAKASRKRNRAA